MGIESVDSTVVETTNPIRADRRERVGVAGARIRKRTTGAGGRNVCVSVREQVGQFYCETGRTCCRAEK